MDNVYSLLRKDLKSSLNGNSSGVEIFEMIRMSPSIIRSKSLNERAKAVPLNFFGKDGEKDSKPELQQLQQSSENMKLRHQNHDQGSSSSNNSGSSMGSVTSKLTKLENGLKKHLSSSETSSKSAGGAKVTPAKKSSSTKNSESGDSSDGLSSDNSPPEPLSPAAKSKTKETPAKVNNSDCAMNGIVKRPELSTEKSTTTKAEASIKKITIDVEFEDTDEEEDNVALKTLMENLEKGLNSGEDAKKSREMLDDLMSDILDKDVKVENGQCQATPEEVTETKLKAEKSRVTNKETGTESKGVTPKQKNAKTASDSAEKMPMPSKTNLELEKKRHASTPVSEVVAGDTEEKIVQSIETVAGKESVNERSNECDETDSSADTSVVDEGVSDFVGDGVSDETEVDKSDSQEVTSDSTPDKLAQLKSVCDDSTMNTATEVCDNDAPGMEDDDVMEIADDKTSDKKRSAETSAESENPIKKPKTDVDVDAGVSKLENNLTRQSCDIAIDVSEAQSGDKAIDGSEAQSGDKAIDGSEAQSGDKAAGSKKEKMYRLTKAELEMLVICKVTEYFNEAHKSEIGAIRKRCEQLEKMLDQWRRKAVFYQKQVTDLQIAVQRVQIKRQAAATKPPMRSVGLQVQLIRDPIKYAAQCASTGGKTMVLPTGGIGKNQQTVQKQTSNGQLAFYTNVGMHGALSNTVSISNSTKSVSQSATGMRNPLSLSNGSPNVSILQTKLANGSSNSMTLNSSATPVPMRLIQNQAVRQVTPSSVCSTSIITPSSHSLTVSVVNQPSILSNAVKLIDLTGEEEEQKAAAAAAAATAAASSGKRIIAKPIAATTTLQTGLTVVPTLSTNSNTVTVLNTANANVGGGQLIAINPGTTLGAVVSGVSTIATAGSVGVTTAIRSPVTAPVASPVRLAYLMQTGSGVMTMVRPTQPVFVAPAPQVRPTQSINQPVIRPSIPATLVFRQGTTLLPIQNGTVHSTQIRPVQTVQPAKIVTSAQSVQSSGTPSITVMGTSPSTVAKAGLSITSKPTTASSISITQSTSPTKSPTYATKHPAPLPGQRVYHVDVPGKKQVPPKPALKISKVDNGIVLSWNMNLNSSHAQISSYQLYAYQETSSPPSTTLWKKVGDVRALPLPMACTLTQFLEGHKYYFAVRAVDVHNRLGPFSDPGSITLFSSSKLASKK